MISTFQTKLNNKIKGLLLVIFGAILFPLSFVAAQNSLALSVSPTLFEITANPTQEWTSNVRVINPNPYEITVFANVVNFAPQGEAGLGKFVPILDEEKGGLTISEWVEITADPIVIPAEQTVEVPFVITVPGNAPPGGHFAALLIGTKPPAREEGVILVETSQIVTTLMFLRVTGDVKELGDIRSFRTTERLLEFPEVTFELRFENKGNVHIQPQGQIEILNMWGQKRGIVPINRDTMFGNVLPESVRKYSFTWTGDWSWADIGRYKAVATLAYGENGRQFAHRETTFWVIPWKILGGVVLFIFGFVALFTWAVKLYIRKVLSMAGVRSNQSQLSVGGAKKMSVVAPIEEGMLDLRGQWRETTNSSERLQAMVGFVKQYKIFFAVAVAIVIFISSVTWYIQSASVAERAYEVIIEGDSAKMQISSEDVEYETLKEEVTVEPVMPDEELPQISIVNRSGVSGLAAELKIRLEGEGYEVVDISNDFGAAEDNTVIVYDPEFAEEALALSQKIKNALLSAFAGASDNDVPITIYVGRDSENDVQ